MRKALEYVLCPLSISFNSSFFLKHLATILFEDSRESGFWTMRFRIEILKSASLCCGKVSILIIMTLIEVSICIFRFVFLLRSIVCGSICFVARTLPKITIWTLVSRKRISGIIDDRSKWKCLCHQDKQNTSSIYISNMSTRQSK